MDTTHLHFESLPLQPTTRRVQLPPSAEPPVALADAATEVYTDLRVAPGVKVPATDSLEDTRRLMQFAGVRMAFVIDAAERVIGLVTLADLQGEHAAQVAAARGMPQRDLPVIAVMLPTERWSTIDLGRLVWAKVGHVIETFRASGQRYLIVTEQIRGHDGAAHTVIRGMFSANRVERAAGCTIEDALRSRSFAELAGALTER